MARGIQRSGIVAAKDQVYKFLQEQDFEPVSIESEACSLEPYRSLSTFVRGLQSTA